MRDGFRAKDLAFLSNCEHLKVFWFLVLSACNCLQSNEPENGLVLSVECYHLLSIDVASSPAEGG